MNNRGVLYQEFGAMFLGGFPDVEGGKKVDITLGNLGLSLNIKGYGTKSLSKSKIKNVEIKTNQQIEREIGLGKLMVFGFLSLAMRSNKTVVKNYVDITYDENGMTRDIILESNSNENLVRQLRCLN
jgi:hypothetical protein